MRQGCRVARFDSCHGVFPHYTRLMRQVNVKDQSGVPKVALFAVNAAFAVKTRSMTCLDMIGCETFAATLSGCA
jgi:hypothetical protein